MQGERLKELREAAGYETLADFARAAGIQPGTADKHVQRDRVPAIHAPKYIDAARGTGADINWLLTGKGSPPKKMFAREPIHIAVSPQKVTATDVDDMPSRLVPLWTVIRRGPGGSVLVTESDEVLPAPTGKRITKSAFVLQIWDDANAPGLRRGSHIYVDRLKIPADGQWCVIACEAEGDGPPTLYKPIVGILNAVKDGAWELWQGAHLLRFAQADWPLSWLIVLIDPI